MTHPTWILIADAAQARRFASDHGYRRRWHNLSEHELPTRLGDAPA